MTAKTNDVCDVLDAAIADIDLRLVGRTGRYDHFLLLTRIEAAIVALTEVRDAVTDFLPRCIVANYPGSAWIERLIEERFNVGAVIERRPKSLVLKQTREHIIELERVSREAFWAPFEETHLDHHMREKVRHVRKRASFHLDRFDADSRPDV